MVIGGPQAPWRTAGALAGASLGRANLGRANLGRANLGRANLGRANLGRANLGRANLGRANLGGASLGGQAGQAGTAARDEWCGDSRSLGDARHGETGHGQCVRHWHERSTSR
ncbi:pentapeptide repeat-containing protein [Paractinoplanes abujensis]|uniref:pentapeptide repeat-containing protein n=1 Tax=Paractinoplanes abujensis TaxID=882441 RepID=UPI0016143232